MSSEFGYWHIRGISHSLRLILAYVGEDVTEKRYTAEDYQQWFSKAKNELDAAFPNLPHYKDGTTGRYITQKHTIMRYLARKYGLDGDDEQSKIRTDMLTEQVRDIHKEFSKVCYPEEGETATKEWFEEKKKPKYLEGLQKKLQLFEDFLEDGKWCAGDKLTYGDFTVYDILSQLLYVEKGLLDKYAKLKNFKERFQALPKIEKYEKSDKCVLYPIFAPWAYLGKLEHIQDA